MTSPDRSVWKPRFWSFAELVIHEYPRENTSHAFFKSERGPAPPLNSPLSVINFLSKSFFDLHLTMSTSPKSSRNYNIRPVYTPTWHRILLFGKYSGFRNPTGSHPVIHHLLGFQVSGNPETSRNHWKFENLLHKLLMQSSRYFRFCQPRSLFFGVSIMI